VVFVDVTDSLYLAFCFLLSILRAACNVYRLSRLEI
jgi:hypothetical protein